MLWVRVSGALTALVLGATLGLAPAARADVITLYRGDVFEGEVLRVTTLHVTLRVSGGTLTFPRTAVRSIEREPLAGGGPAAAPSVPRPDDSEPAAPSQTARPSAPPARAEPTVRPGPPPRAAPEPDPVARLMRLLAPVSPALSEEAAWNLQAMGPVAAPAGPLLRAVARDPERLPAVRAACLEAVAAVLPAQGMGLAAELLGEEERAIRVSALLVLRSGGRLAALSDDALRQLLHHLVAGSPAVRIDAVAGLAAAGDAMTHWTVLIDVVERAPEVPLRAAAARALAPCPHRDCLLAALRALREDRAPLVRTAACAGLAMRADPRTVPALLHALHDYDPGVSRAAAAALERITGQHLGPSRHRWRRWWQEQERGRYLDAISALGLPPPPLPISAVLQTLDPRPAERRRGPRRRAPRNRP